MEETTLDRTRLKAGVVIGYWEKTPETMEFTIHQAGLRHLWKPKFRRVHHYLKYDGKIIKDPTWADEAIAFSKANRRGKLLINHDGVEMTIIGTDRRRNFGRRAGFNDTFTARICE